MKKLLTAMLAVALITQIGYSQGNNGNTPAAENAQSNTRWKLDGNMLDGTEKFIGTKNEKDLIFKSNSQEVMRLRPDKGMMIPGQMYMEMHKPTDPGKENILTIDKDGKVKSMEKAGLLNTIYGNPCFFSSKDGVTNYIYSPAWASEPGKMYTGVPCDANIGIGTDEPIETLDVRGSGFFANIGLGEHSDINNKLTLLQSDPHRNGIVVNITGSNPNLLEGVGIKTIVNNPLRKAMTVVDGSGTTEKEVFRVYGNGLIEAKKLRLSLNIWSDFVFDDDYELIPLPELEKYIDKNNHLPEVPSEKEVLEEGVELGEMDAILLQKVEELTLYLIEVNKQVQELKEENKELKKELGTK